MLCGATPNCGCTLSTTTATTGTITGSVPTITVAGAGSSASPWTMTLDSAWATKVANAVIPTPWVDMTLINGWLQYDTTGNTWTRPAYRKVGDMVYLRGLLARAGASAGVGCFFLPVGFRPPTTLMIPADIQSLIHGRCDVDSTGEIRPHYVAGTADYYSLSNVYFSVTA